MGFKSRVKASQAKPSKLRPSVARLLGYAPSPYGPKAKKVARPDPLIVKAIEKAFLRIKAKRSAIVY